ncbi:MAG: ABC transporter permease subunit, partial [Propionibacteriaceae bacterium]|nr:ABC transporter permease subunit [Propionibacteriaceae bacterium]
MTALSMTADAGRRPPVTLHRVGTYLGKPQNTLLLILGIVLTVSTIAPLLTIVIDTVSIHPGSVDDPLGLISGYTSFNWTNLFTGMLRKINFWVPLQNSLLIAVLACAGAIIYGGFFAYLVTRSNMRFKKYLSAIFIFPYIMPQWTLAVVWSNLFKSKAAIGGSDGLLASVFGIAMPDWWVRGVFPCSVVLAIHYSAFAYILIGGIFRNMDANLEEAALILNTPRWKTFTRVTIPIVTPAVLSTILLVFSAAMGSYPVPHYLNLDTLATKYIDLNVNRQGQASILAVTLMVFGIALMVANQFTTAGRKSYTTVTGKSGQTTLVNLGVAGRSIAGLIFIVTTLFTSIYPIVAFAFETFLPNPGDYSFLRTWDTNNLTTKWWVSSSNIDSTMYGQNGVLHNSLIWNAAWYTLLVALLCAVCAGTIGTLIGYCVSKNRRSRWANFVNNMAFLPYLMPS